MPVHLTPATERMARVLERLSMALCVSENENEEKNKKGELWRREERSAKK